MQIQLMSCSCDPLQVNKASYLKGLKTLDVEPYEPCDLDRPTFVVDYDSIKDIIGELNYCYVPEWSTYYYLQKDPTLDAGGICYIACKTDVLMTYSPQIRGAYAYIERQEYDYDMYIRDAQIPVQNRNQLVIKAFSGTPFTANPTGRCYSLVVSGSTEITS